MADALTAHGFAAHAEKRGNELRIVNNHCPFGAAAIEHPVICAVDRGMVKGMLAALYGDTEPEIASSLAAWATRSASPRSSAERRRGPALPRPRVDSPLRPAAAEAMVEWLEDGRGVGDPARIHAEGHAARAVVEDGRAALSPASLGCRPR